MLHFKNIMYPVDLDDEHPLRRFQRERGKRNPQLHDNHQMDLIIVGHKHRSKLYSSMFDGADVNIIDTVKLPVLVIPEK